MDHFRNFFYFIYLLILSISFAIPAEELTVNVYPKGEIEKLELVTEISITFNKPMVPIGEIRKEYKPAFVSIKSQIKGKFYWAGDRILIFKLEEKLPFSTSFEVRIKKSTKSLTGEILNKDIVSVFETPPPSVIRTKPYQGSKIGRNGNIILFFNQPVSLQEVESEIRLIINPLTTVLRIDFS